MMNIQPSFPKPKRVHWPSLIQLVFSVFAALTSLGMAAIFILGSIIDMISARSITEETIPYLLMAAGSGMGGLLLIPSAGYAFLGLIQRPSQFMSHLEAYSRRFVRPTLLIFLFPVVLLLGHLVSKRAQLAWFTLPGLHILAVGLPILWLAYLGWRGLPTGSNQRAWGVFGVGLIVGPSLILILELMALSAIFMVGLMYIALNPELARELNALATRLQFVDPSPEKILPLISPYLAQPLVLFALFAFTAGVVPLIEEVLKPVGVWLFVGANITPAEGFTLGLLSGSGYALFENLAFSASAGGNWTEVVVSRIGTGLLHVLTAGLTGWALAGAWKENRYIRLGLVYLSAVLIHSLWNGMALLTSARNFATPEMFVSDLTLISRAAAIGLGTLALVMLIILLMSNTALRRSLDRISAEPGEQITPGKVISVADSSHNIPGA